MLDCEIYGLNPLGHHITSLLIHIVNTLLLFFLLSRMTGAVWRSSFVAAAFALHPIHVESVAWAAERKDVFSGLFWMLTILAYVHYAKQPNIRRYVLVLLAFAMGLMSKPMVVTLPFVLLLLDWWPLDRLLNDAASVIQKQGTSATYQKATLWHLVAEKVPLFVLSAIASIITFVVQKRYGAVNSLAVWPLPIRVINALGSYFNYIMKILYPKGLAALYPITDRPTVDAVVLAVVGVIALLRVWGRGRRWLVVGLLWYLGTLVPVIGLVKVGWQTMADRYTYLPSIGVFLVIAWGAEEIFSKMRHSKVILATGAAVALTAMVLATRIQVGYWRDSPTLYQRALAVTKNNFVMHNNYGLYLCLHGQYEEGIRQFKEAAPFYPTARANICWALLIQTKFDEAISCLTKMLREKNDWPNMEEMYNRLGYAYAQKGDLTLAEVNFRKALSLKPDYEPARKNLALALAKQGKMTVQPKADMGSQQNW
jgi:Tfp pilus assembly protein PilF